MVPSLVQGLMLSAGGKGFDVLQSAKLTINGHPAYQVVARGIKDHTDAFCVATSIDFGKRIAVAYLLVPVKNGIQDGPADAEHAVVWGYYQDFVKSIESHVASP